MRWSVGGGIGAGNLLFVGSSRCVSLLIRYGEDGGRVAEVGKEGGLCGMMGRVEKKGEEELEWREGGKRCYPSFPFNVPLQNGGGAAGRRRMILS